MDLSKDRLSGIFESNGFSLIRKGVFFAQDIYADGLKRSDINVIVDGERYHTACPNRMDSPLTRVNQIELESVSLMKTSGDLLSGLGGVVNFHRKVPSENTTPAWYKADIGIRYKLDHLNISLMIENVTNQLYYKHLSYLRNPFASGVDVFEPGRNVYLSFTYSI